MIELELLVTTFVLLWAVIDPIGSVPVFLAVTSKHDPSDLKKIAIQSVLIAGGILVFFIVAGQFVLDGMGVPLSAFQVSGGLVLFAFAFNMIFGESKPEEEVRIARKATDTAIFPLAVPCIAGPGAMMAVVLLTDNNRFDVMHQLTTTSVLFSVLAIQLLIFLGARHIHKLIGDSGAGIISRVMGIILASVAVNSVLSGLRDFFAV